MAQDTLKDFVRLALSQGWRVEQRKTGHWTFYPLDKAHSPVVVAGTPSDHRSWKNAKAHLKRAGLQMGTFADLLTGKK